MKMWKKAFPNIIALLSACQFSGGIQITRFMVSSTGNFLKVWKKKNILSVCCQRTDGIKVEKEAFEKLCFFRWHYASIMFWKMKNRETNLNSLYLVIKIRGCSIRWNLSYFQLEKSLKNVPKLIRFGDE